MGLSDKAREFMVDVLDTEYEKLKDYVLVDDPQEFVPMARCLDEIAAYCFTNDRPGVYEGQAKIDLEDAMRPVPVHLYRYGGFGVDVKLASRNDPADVYWSEGYNSFVLVHPHIEDSGNWFTPDGQRCDLVSINGIGEIRWVVTGHSRDEGAIEHFKLRKKV